MNILKSTVFVVLLICCVETNENKKVDDDLEVIKKLRMNKLDNIEPAQHMDAMPFEADGRMNKDFHKELFLGDHEELEQLDDNELNSRFKSIFTKIDTNKNNVLNEDEVENWMLQQINMHFTDAISKNEKMFLYIDSDKNGIVYWNEYENLYNKLHNLDHDHNDPHFKETVKQELTKLQNRWKDSDKNNDGGLDKSEFLIFRHPETVNGDNSIKELAEGMLQSMDMNGDGVLNMEEFTFLLMDDNMNEDQQRFLKERQDDFKTIDKDNNGKLDINELKESINPRNPRMIKKHVKKIFEFIDDDHNSLIDLNEMLEHKRFLIDNNLYHPGDMVHDEL